MTTDGVSNAASALGQGIGKLFEDGVIEVLREDVEARGHTIRAATLENGTGNNYQIDGVVFDSEGRPVVIIDVKYIRYHKHNRDKGSWLCTAHYNLRKTYPTLRKAVAVLAGRWSPPSKALIRSFGVETIEETFEYFVAVLDQYNIPFDWPERDRETPALALARFKALSEGEHWDIATALSANMADEIRDAVTQVLDADMSTLPSRITGVEIILQTDQNEMLLMQLPNVVQSIQALTGLVSDQPDISTLLARHPHEQSEDDGQGRMNL